MLAARLRFHLSGQYAATVAYMGWSGKKNGELLALMAANGFEVLLTSDQNLKHQQNLNAFGVAAVVLKASSTALPDLIGLIPDALTTLNSIQPGDVVEISP